MKKDPNRYPRGLDAKKVRAIIAYHDSQSDEAAAAEAEAAFVNSSTALVRVPTELLDEVQALLARAASERSKRAGVASNLLKILRSSGYKGTGLKESDVSGMLKTLRKTRGAQTETKVER
ncbi:MAG: hypothetical protein IT432_10590 [Phycisphaerales bacterium]|nr:hypothetical protein [Phycisphaerales bacterium]